MDGVNINYYELRLQEINYLLGMGIESRSPVEAERLKRERDELLDLLNALD